MSPRDPDLPDFDRPPVVEVALSVQFAPLTEMKCAHFGLLWQEKYKERFPVTEEWPPLDPVIEKFGTPLPRRPRLRISPVPPVPRVWFLNEPGTELLQIQQDRFVRNWRKAKAGEKYPHYEEHIRPKFRDEFGEFLDFLDSRDVGALEPTQCEITYVNHMFSGDGWEQFGQMENVLAVWQREYSHPCSLGEPEDVRVAIRYLIPDAEGRPIGRLHVGVEPHLSREDGKPLLQMKLTARGGPLDRGLDGILRFMDIGRRWIVRGFASVTTDRMHDVWGRRDDH